MHVGHGQVGIHLDICHPTVVYARLVLLSGSFKSKSGEMSFGFSPFSHGESQKGAIFPFQIVVVVAA
jgi:hypothetical protein